MPTTRSTRAPDKALARWDGTLAVQFSNKRMEVEMLDFEKLLNAVDNPITRGVLAAGGTAALIAATTAFAPVGVVGAAGWTLVYWVFGGTVTLDVAKRMWNLYSNLSAEKRSMFNGEMDKLKRLFEDGAISKDEFNSKAKNLYENYSI